EREAYEALPEGQKLAEAERLAIAAESEGDAERALFWRKEAVDRARTPSQKSRADDGLRTLIEGMSALDVERLAPLEDPTSEAAPLLAFQLAMIHHQRRDWEHLREALEDFLDAYPHHPYGPRARELLEKI